MFSQEEIAGPNDKFSRHAARKPMIARYRRMPRGRPAMTSCSLAQTELLRHRFWAAELLICGRRKLCYCEPARDFGLRSRNRTIATFQNYWTAELSEFRPKELHYCQPATDFGLRDDNQTIANLRKILIRVLYRTNKPPQVCCCAASD